MATIREIVWIPQMSQVFVFAVLMATVKEEN